MADILRTIETSEPLPCPKCGHEPDIEQFCKKMRVVCRTLPAGFCGSGPWKGTFPSAIRNWNIEVTKFLKHRKEPRDG